MRRFYGHERSAQIRGGIAGADSASDAIPENLSAQSADPVRHFVSPARLDLAENFEQLWWLNLSYGPVPKHREDVRLEPADGVGAMPFAPSAAHFVDEIK